MSKKCDDCFYSERCFMKDENCGQYFYHITKADAAAKYDRERKNSGEGKRVMVYDLKMKPVGQGVVEYVSINALPKEKQEELRTAGTDIWTRVHMDNGTKLFAFDHYIQFLDDTPLEVGTDAPPPTYPAHESRPKPVAKKRGRSASATNISSLESWLTKKEGKP